MMILHYLTTEEEKAIKANIPWVSIDRKARELIALANSVEGLATIQSCAGHAHNSDGTVIVSDTHVAFRAEQFLSRYIVFSAAPECGIQDLSIRYFDDGTFWIFVSVDPSEREKLHKFFNLLKRGDADGNNA